MHRGSPRKCHRRPRTQSSHTWGFGHSKVHQLGRVAQQATRHSVPCRARIEGFGPPEHSALRLHARMSPAEELREALGAERARAGRMHVLHRVEEQVRTSVVGRPRRPRRGDGQARATRRASSALAVEPPLRERPRHPADDSRPALRRTEQSDPYVWRVRIAPPRLEHQHQRGGHAERPQPNAPQVEQRRGKYTFTVDWFSRHLPVWNEVLMPLRGRPLRALEIGCFEGAATTWLLDNVLVDAGW